jgi:hypothetical protein
MLAALLLVVADRDLAAGAPGVSDTAIIVIVVILVAIQLLVGVDILDAIRGRRPAGGTDPD